MKEILLTKGMVALVDDCDYQRVNQYKWYYDNSGYARRTIYPNGWAGKREAVKMHRFIINAPDGIEVDHRNGDRTDNQRHNIRLCSDAQNSRNAQKRIDNTSGYKGVTYHIRMRKWASKIQVDRKRMHLGYFSTPEAAAQAYDQAALQYHGEFANLNFPLQKVA